MASRRTRVGIALVNLAVACAMVGGGCTPRGGPPADAASPVPESLAESLSTPDSLATATPAGVDAFETALAPLREVDIIARLDGEVVGVYFEEGQRVSAGERLAQLDDRERLATLEERKAEAARAEAAWKRAQSLFEQKVVAEEQYIGARSDWQIAEAQRARAGIEWERCVVRTPIAGVIGLRRVQTGQMVKQGDLLFRIADPDTLRAELLVPESRLGTVHPGQRVQVVPAAGGPARSARVTRVNPLVDPASGTFRVVIDIDNRSGGLRGGVSARVVFDRAVPR